MTQTVSDANPTGGDSVVYTVTVANRTASLKWLDEIKVSVDVAFIYDCDATADQLTLPDGPSEDLAPDHRSHGHFCDGDGDRNIQWDLDFFDGFIESGEEITLTYTVVTSAMLGTYCSEAKADPDDAENRTGANAVVQIGSTPGVCSDEAMNVTKTWTSATLVSTNESTTPFTYTFTIDFEILLDNIGDASLDIDGFYDLLPLGFSYTSMDLAGDITTAPASTDTEGTTGREEVIWEFDPDVSVSSGSSKTLKYTATVTRGNYWSDLLTDFDADFPVDKYTWPTAMIAVRDVFLNTATAVDDSTIVANISLNVASESGTVGTWDLP